ncbi:MAG: hypothetical protein PT941_05980 [Bacillales bacterium]|nr:hypothetical protein [Bacillales bacterium]
MTKANKINYVINLMFFLYFIVLFIERVISLSLTFINKIDIFKNFFSISVYFSIFLSLIGFFIYLAIKCRKNIKALFSLNNDDLSFNELIIAGEILLISGMVHSEYTISIVQFISYGFYILAVVLKVISFQNEVKNKTILYLSLIYLVCYSMAIPVTYQTFLNYSDLYHVISLIASYLLVGIFTYMTHKLFNNEENLFRYIYILPAVILDTFLIAFRWKEEINVFVLIFICLSFLLFISGRIILYIKKEKIKNN